MAPPLATGELPPVMHGIAEGTSSLGLINPGDQFMVVPGLYALEKPGNVITFVVPQGPDKGRIASHVVIERKEADDGTITYRTRGANNPYDDPWVVDQSMYRGRVLGKKFDISKFAPAQPLPKPKVIRR